MLACEGCKQDNQACLHSSPGFPITVPGTTPPQFGSAIECIGCRARARPCRFTIDAVPAPSPPSEGEVVRADTTNPNDGPAQLKSIPLFALFFLRTLVPNIRSVTDTVTREGKHVPAARRMEGLQVGSARTPQTSNGSDDARAAKRKERATEPGSNTAAGPAKDEADLDEKCLKLLHDIYDATEHDVSCFPLL